MSHLSQINTNIYDLNVLQNTLLDLGFKYKSNIPNEQKPVIYQGVDLLVFSTDELSNPLFGFMYDGQKYVLVTDIYFWKLDCTIDSFINKLTQSYALNVILDKANHDGFEAISQQYQLDGSVELVVQKWIS